MSKVASREKDPRSSGAATSSSSSSRAKPSSSSQSSSTQPRSDGKATSSQAPTSFVASKSSAEPPVAASVPKPGVHDMRAHEWKNFFLDSGIPDHAAMEYATIFVKERINWQILKNLDKGYLTDMGINCIGDQIAILQAAKKYCGEQYTPGHAKPPAPPQHQSAAPQHQPVMRMDMEEVHRNGSPPPPAQPRSTVARRVVQVPEKVVVRSTISRLSPKKTVISSDLGSSVPTSRSVLQSDQSHGYLRNKRAMDDDGDDRLAMKRASTQPARQVRLPPDDTSFTVRLGSGTSVKRGDVFSRLSQKGAKPTSNTNLVRVLETRMSRLSTGPTSAMPSNGATKPTLVSDTIGATPTPIRHRLGSSNAAIRTQSVPSSRPSTAGTVFSRLGYQSKPKNTAAYPNANGDSRKLSVHDRLGTRR
ncbi:hypothetical protein BV898_14794 [Hypsibius exemplaris]|uniref:SAM domain-containing protein n=1 Tax=Hypsibius exemplaris TaxID=2072580 RepID=A0A9X6RJU2_HYPEX|nr:hypothetical protein BV898_14794 [Hypsibius exemplaris]